MILDELTLHDYGLYGGRQSVILTPVDRQRPVVLFGGLNGGGKTTLLDALQLGFYGPLAQLSNRNGLAYDEYLRRSVHRGAAVPEAAIEVAFRHTVAGEEQSYRLHRSWTTSRSGDIRERFEVIRNGRVDRLATEHWGAQVEEFIPARIAHLFLFDGEKVEAYADLQGAQALVSTAIHNLLGLDIVERLTADLIALERRNRVEQSPREERSGLEAVRAEIEQLEARRAKLVQEQGAGANKLDRLHRNAADLDHQFRREGGELHEMRSAKEAELAIAERQLDAARRTLRDLASGAAPLLLVQRLLASVATRDAGEETSRRARDTLEMLRVEHAALLALPALQSLNDRVRRDLQVTLQDRLKDRAAAALAPRVLDLDPQARTVLTALRTTELAELEPALRTALATEMEARDKVDELRAEIAAIPSPEAIASLVAARGEARLAVQTAEAEQLRGAEAIAAVEQQLSGLRQREERLLGDEARARFDREDSTRMLSHSARVRGTLDQFRGAVIARHVGRIQALVLDSFRQLIRKEGLIADLRIDPQTFALSLTDGAGRMIGSERLSAGERQLLAIALLWGLARAAGRPLPTVIDTPLGRLDAQHRDHLVRRYFPNASHQVILLSTDEEITGRHLAALRPSIGREYRLRFDEAEGRTVIEPGYFGGEEALLAYAS